MDKEQKDMSKRMIEIQGYKYKLYGQIFAGINPALKGEEKKDEARLKKRGKKRKR
jgi:hypothetical protein